jgi:hypothetical protein
MQELPSGQGSSSDGGTEIEMEQNSSGRVWPASRAAEKKTTPTKTKGIPANWVRSLAKFEGLVADSFKLLWVLQPIDGSKTTPDELIR